MIACFSTALKKMTITDRRCRDNTHKRHWASVTHHSMQTRARDLHCSVHVKTATQSLQISAFLNWRKAALFCIMQENMFYFNSLYRSRSVFWLNHTGQCFTSKKCFLTHSVIHGINSLLLLRILSPNKWPSYELCVSVHRKLWGGVIQAEKFIKSWETQPQSHVRWKKEDVRWQISVIWWDREHRGMW